MNNFEFELPVTVTIGNKGKFTKGFIPYKENFVTYLNSGAAITMDMKTSNEAIYYTHQADKDIIVGVNNANAAKAETGVYDLSTSTFTVGASYDIIKDGYNCTIIGTIPYEEEISSLGLPAGNRVTFRIDNNVPYADLPSGIILKVSNPAEASGFNEYKKDAFETDGSFVTLMNVHQGSTFEVQIKWADGAEFEIYNFTVDANLVQE